ncbi:MAG TPA: nucleotidyltransferase family protein [Woeseiaceae bacterium]|nr:nucleotidyltransferase family protein [Woeseiaceae bacterium]
MTTPESVGRAAHEVRKLLNLVVRQPERLPELSLPDLDLTLRAARRARLLGHLGYRLRDQGSTNQLPQVALDQLHGGMAMADARARLASWELDRIAWAMSSGRQVPLVVMKGCAYLFLRLPNAPGRLFADVDLMVAENDLHYVEEVLEDMGWESAELTPYDDNYYRRWTHELPPLTHVEREVEIDLHHNILPRTARLKPSGERILAQSHRLPDSRYAVPCDEDIVLHAMVHLMFDSDLADKLRDLVDIADLLDHFAGADAAFWDRLVLRASELDLRRPAYYSLRYASRLLDTDYPERIAGEIRRWAPPWIVVRIMDRLVPRALYPQHPDLPSRATELARLLLYVRSHWLRMPPWLLAYHLSVKFLRKNLRLA